MAHIRANTTPTPFSRRWTPATVLLRETTERGYTGGISQLKAYLAPFKRLEPEPVVRFETQRGKQAQADLKPGSEHNKRKCILTLRLDAV